MKTRGAKGWAGRGLLQGAALALGALSLPAAVNAQEPPGLAPEAQPSTTSPGSQEGPRTPVTQGQAESSADTLGTDRLLETGDGAAPVGDGQAESRADALGGVDDEGALPFGQQPAGTGRGQQGQGFGDQGVLGLGQQPVVDDQRPLPPGGTEPGAEGQDLPDASLGARGVDVEDARVETLSPDVDRAARGVESTEPGGIEQPLEDVDLRARGVRLQGEQVNERLDDVRAETSRGVEPSEGPRAAPSEIPGRNVPGGGVIVVPGTGAIVVDEGGQILSGPGVATATQMPGGALAPAAEGIEPVGEGVAPVGSGVLAAASTGLREAEPLERASITGRVVEVSYSEAVAAIATEEEGLIAVRARPQEIALLQPGDRVALEVMEVGDAIWISPAARYEPASADVTALPGTGALSRDLSSPIFEERGTAEGVVTAVNPSEGLFRVGEQEFQAHPLEIQNLEPGQMVSLVYGTVDEERWAADIRVSP